MKFVKTLILIVFVSGLLVFFQNCGVPQNTGLLGTRESSLTDADQVVINAPFAYDLAVDTISYNSCVGDNLNSSSEIHGLKIGVNEGFTDNLGTGAVKAGLKLRSDFLKYVGETTKPRYPSTVITPAQVQNVIRNSPLNKEAVLQFAVRKAGDLTAVIDQIQPNTIVPLPGRDGVNFAGVAAESLLTQLTKNVQFNEAGAVLSEGSRIYNLSEVENPTPIQATFGFSNYADETFPLLTNNPTADNHGIGERYSETIRNRFNLGSGEKHILTVTYGTQSKMSDADSGLNSILRKDETTKTKAYGRGFALTFGYPAQTVAAGWKNTVLKEVKESNLEGGLVSGASWSCSSYVIMKQSHWNSGKLSEPSCTPINATDLQNTVFAEKVRNLRRHYTEGDWNIGLFYEKNETYNPATRLSHSICLVPKTTECYLPTQNIIIPGTDVGVNYNPLTECYLSNPVSVSYANPLETVKAAGRCAQFASVCVRTSTNF